MAGTRSPENCFWWWRRPCVCEFVDVFRVDHFGFTSPMLLRASLDTWQRLIFDYLICTDDRFLYFIVNLVNVDIVLTFYDCELSHSDFSGRANVFCLGRDIIFDWHELHRVLLTERL
jgi:hypothetical protein